MFANARGINAAVADGYKRELATVTGFDRGRDAEDKCYGNINNYYHMLFHTNHVDSHPNIDASATRHSWWTPTRMAC